MRYMVLIYWDESPDEMMGVEDRMVQYEAYRQFNETCQKQGVFVTGNALQATSFATTIRIRHGRTITTDGPFAETKEQFGGFYILECEHLDEVISWAEKIPHAQSGSIEIRPILEH